MDQAVAHSAPGHLAAIAALFGLDVADVSTARVLEIGCSAGGNLIPFAAWHPGARAVGIDLAQVQIDKGRSLVQALGLRNVELVSADITQIDIAALGQFDFIVCHGVYSWVPVNVQQAILAALRTALAPNGIGYISYNTYPGWKAKEIVRDAMLLRGSAATTPQDKISYALGMVEFLEEVAPADSVLAKALSDFRAGETTTDHHLLQDELAAVNSPCYLIEMASRAEANGLVYLADVLPHTMFASNYGEKVAAPLLKECGHNQVLLEQYLDFVVTRTFRQSLFVHAERGPQIRYVLDPERYRRLHFAAWLPALDERTRLDDSPQEFGLGAQVLTTAVPDVKAAMEALTARWPWTLSRRELLETVRARLSSAGLPAAANQERVVDELLEYLIVHGLARYRLDPVLPPPTPTPPRLDEPTRRLAELVRGDAEALVFNAWHESVPLSAADRQLLPLLDGTRDRDALVAALLAATRAGALRFERDGELLSAEADIGQAAAEHVDTLAERLTAMKLWREVEARHSRFH